MGKIVLLDELTINQIAAGEVIERPASVVKEMVENSIDAGSKNITVEIKNGGLSLIKITDDGSGIAADDMEIAFERHATSKIRKAEDLEKVETMGFRGEALASVAAIAKVEMVSRTDADEIGHKLIIEGGKVLEKEDIAAQKGTRITVQNIFYNTPVRYKFLKKDYTESGYIETVITRLALINTNVAIKLISNDKVLVQTTGNGNLKDVIYAIYGKDIAKGIIDVDYNHEGIKVTGVIGVPSIARSNRSNQMFFVNNRYIKDGKLASAVEQAYSNTLPIGKYPFTILNMEIDPKKVDVNVHPAKTEVRFADEYEAYIAIHNAIKNALSTQKFENKNIFEKEDDIQKNVIATNPVVQDTKIESTLDLEDKQEASQKSKISDILKKFSKETSSSKKDDEKVVEIKLPENIVNNAKEEITSDFNINKYKEDLKNIEKSIIANRDIVEKTTQINDTKISSNTKELDFDISESLKEATQAVNTIKEIEIDETQAIPVTKENISQETQIIDLNKDIEKEAEKDIKIQSEENEIKNNQEFDDTSKEENIESTVPSVEAVENITSRILELKMNNKESTQIIDTNKVREAINEVKDVTPEFADMYKKTFGVDANVIRKERENEEREKEKEREKINVANDFVSAENDNLFENEEVVPARINYKLIGVAFNTNIIIELDNEMYIINQNSALERITYEIVKQNYFKVDGKDSQNLLLPDIITVSYREMSIAHENIELFRNAGISFEDFGENTLKLTAVPSFCEDLNTKQIFINVLNEIDRVALNDVEEKEEKFIIALAKNATKKMYRALDTREIDELLQRLLSLDNPFNNPIEPTTAIKMSRNDIEKKFSRR